MFVVQKHAASHLHYDLRLEHEGVLKSWAVPRGPDVRPGEKRLAIQVEDHPLAYGTFEGIIPAGQYGGGTVLLWDRGTWESLGPVRNGLRDGRLKFRLHGERLQGGWMLVRRGGRHAPDDERNWFLFKERDEFADDDLQITEELSLSVTTHRTLEEIAADVTPNSRDRAPVASRSRKQRDSRPMNTNRGRVRPVARHGAKASSRPDMRTSKYAEVAGVRLSHPDKVLYPEHGITKLELALYYERIADWILPHIVDRPLAIVRCPSGIGGSCFFQKHPGAGETEHLQQIDISTSATPDYQIAVSDLAGLISLVQMGTLEIHTWGSQSHHLEKPNQLVFDLDPDPAVKWPQVVRAAREIRLFLEELGLVSFLKITGGKGLHVVVPIQQRTPWDEVKAFCRKVALSVAAAAPDRYVATMSKAARQGKIFVDYLRNDRGATAIAPYSTRARPGAPVSVPLAWGELTNRVHSDRYSVRNLPRRMSQLAADPWQELPHVRQSITAAMRKRLMDL